MEKINIPMGGMSFIPDDNYSKDGDFQLLVNLRNEGGELVTMKMPSKRLNPKSVIMAKYHAKSGKWLELTEDGELWLRDGTEAIQAGVESFAVMGNVVVMYREKMKPCYLIWRGTEYVNLGQMPELPELKITKNNKSFAFTTQEKYPASIMLALEDDGLENYAGYVKKGFIDSCLSEVYSRRGFVDNALFRVCYRLFDGSCIASDIYCAYNDVMAFSFLPEKGTINDNRLNYKAQVIYFTVDVSLHNFTGIEMWKDIITGIEVYTSGSIMNHKPVTVSYSTDVYKGVEDAYVKYDIYEFRTLEDMRQEIMNARFYKYMSFDLKGELIEINIENTSPSNVATQPLLKDIMSMHSGTGCAGVYNSRLHTNGDRLLYDGYRYKNRIGVINDLVTVVTDIEQYIVKRSEKQDDTGLGVTPILMYPDSRAEKMTVAYKYGYNWYKGEFELTPHPYENAAIFIKQGVYERERKFSKSLLEVNIPGGTSVNVNDFYFPEIEEGTYVFEYKKEDGFWRFKKDWVQVGSGQAYPLIRKGRLSDFGITQNGTIDQDSSFKIDVLYVATGEGYALSKITFKETTKEEYDEIAGTEENRLERANDELKVSAVDNPFYFPTAQTYKFDAEIVGVASNAEAISTGQFGQYPLFVFTKSGIWAMGVDASGQGAYTTMSPFSREVCEGAICPVSGGVVFTTINGVRIISGGQIMDISRSIDNDNAAMIYTYSKGLYDDITKLANSDWKIYPVGVRNYINGANIAYKAMLAYNYIRNEIILSNKNYKYSYVYNLNTQSWSVVDYVFDVVTNSYPTLVVYDDNMRMTFDESTVGGNIAAISRPMKYGSLGYKRLRQAALRGTFECFGVLGFYILGSNDGVTFRCLTGKEYKEEETNRDLVTEMARSKHYKYLAYAIAGKANGRFSMVEMLLDGDFANSKLR